MEISNEDRAAVGETVVKLERDFYGRGPGSVKVSIGGGDLSVITVLSVDSLSAMDRTLIDRDRRSAVVSHHQAVNDATADDFCDAIADIVGRGVDSYLAQVDPSTGYAVRVFVFDSDS